MGKESWRVPLLRWPTPFDAVVLSILAPCELLGGIYFVRKFPQYGTIIFLTFIILGMILYLYYADILRKYHFTSEREKAYFRRYPERKHYNLWVLFLIPIILLIVSIIIFIFGVNRLILNLHLPLDSTEPNKSMDSCSVPINFVIMNYCIFNI